MGAEKLKIESPEQKETPVALAHGDDHDDFYLGSAKKGEEGEGPWLVSYADMMTLLMGFFALIASFSKPDAKEFEKVAAASSQYFGGEYQAPYEQLGNAIMKLIKENKVEDQVEVVVDVNGVTLTFSGTLFFDSGNYQVKPEAKELIYKLGETIKKEPKVYNAVVEGHTDSVPITHPILASNWELSGVRASRIAQLFEERGFQKNQLTIMGWGETKPVSENSTIEGRTKNRRVVIRVFSDKPK